MGLMLPFFENFMPDPTGEIFDTLWNSMTWVRHGPRNECWMNDNGTPYTYGRGAGVRTYTAEPWNQLAKIIRMSIHVKTKNYFNACFVNGYVDSSDHLGWHSDDSPEINPHRAIGIVSFGATRQIWFRKIGDGSGDVWTFTLVPGSLLIMPAGLQQTHQHRIPKASYKCGPRISLTYRSLLSYG
jgi:alkylated DNA repair dioxygenase AlkB